MSNYTGLTDHEAQPFPCSSEGVNILERSNTDGTERLHIEACYSDSAKDTLGAQVVESPVEVEEGETIRDLPQIPKPIKLFSELVLHPEDLMRVMLITSTSLAGSKALSYFAQGYTTSDSDWDFYCVSGVTHFLEFITYMFSVGFVLDKWWGQREGMRALRELWPEHLEPLPGDHDDDTDGLTYPPRSVYCLLEGSIGGQRVQLIHNPNTSILETVLMFHSAHLSCFVSASHAVCMHPDAVRKKQSARRIPLDRPSVDYRTVKAWMKYSERGVKYLDGREFIESQSATECQKSDNSHRLMAYFDHKHMSVERFGEDVLGPLSEDMLRLVHDSVCDTLLFEWAEYIVPTDRSGKMTYLKALALSH